MFDDKGQRPPNFILTIGLDDIEIVLARNIETITVGKLRTRHTNDYIIGIAKLM
jgi:hypothetical protein